ncbi:MAG: amino acid ABC transporter substrate-binding protein [Selenomonadaceae bacterium]|nr:amino acid ABC transporter substrate-binding protein [Selenomonadaceae bacterium]
MKKIFVVTLLLLTMVITGCGGKKIVVGIDDEFAPICFHNEDQELVGFDIDLAKEASRRMGVEFVFKPINWNNKREEITSGKVDMIWNGLDITDERKEYMIFTEPYMDDRQILMVKKGNNLNINSEGDLEGKIVGTQAGSTSDCYINNDENLKRSLKDYKVYTKFNDVVEALKSGEIDVLICDELVARYEINKHSEQLELVDVSIGTITEMAIGFRKDGVELRDKVQKIFDEMISDGTAAEISEKWFQANVIKRRI